MNDKQSSCPVFDAHLHIGAYGEQVFAGRTIAPIPAALDHTDGAACSSYLDRHGLAGGVIVPTYLDDQSAAFGYNRLVIDAVAHDPRLSGGLWVSPLDELQGLTEAALVSLPLPGIRALKMASNTWRPHGIDPSSWTRSMRRTMEYILETAAAHRLIIHFHTGYLPGAEPEAFDRFMAEYGAAARYQLVHMGEAIAPAFAFMPLFAEWIERGYDVYTDTSIVPGFAPAWLLETLDRRNLGASRVFFATDAPWGRYEAEYAKIIAATDNPLLRRQLLYQNAATAYNVAPALPA